MKLMPAFSTQVHAAHSGSVMRRALLLLANLSHAMSRPPGAVLEAGDGD